MPMHFDLVDLQLIVHIAETGSLTKGAQALHISVPAASTRIKNLEESFGVKLFYRTSQGVTLTPPGDALVHHARLLRGQVDHLRGDMLEYAKGVKGHLRVFANTTAMEFLPAVLRTYLRTHPDINIDLKEHLSHDVVKAVGEGQTDIGIVAGDVRTEKLHVIPFRTDRLVLVVPAGHALADSQGVYFEETLELQHIGLHEGAAIHGFLRRICEALNRPFPLRIQVGNFESACRMIEAATGVGVMPHAVAMRHAQRLDIRAVPLRDEWALRELKICVRSLASLPAFARDLMDLLAADAATARDGDAPALRR
ncbi:LysR family transcriptional regulator [Variovorax sp. PBL-E5]|uniref:LysR family transcriptional regulator n=1 Tax=Variovorax sp. PBL-E5 TaxID=434014 RepID=UPI00131810F8|nr:LysR family transcriptional regulator [Variovorax sp. PBL-E5]VTU28910.1 CysJI operon transcriptional activator [Variovorax sp. PBL-E5]